MKYNSMRTITEKERKKILRLHKEYGLIGTVIAKRLRVSNQTIYKILQKGK